MTHVQQGEAQEVEVLLHLQDPMTETPGPKMKVPDHDHATSKSSEKFLILTIILPQKYKPIKVLDSLKFMNESLVGLVDDQKKGVRNMEEGFPQFCYFFRSMGYNYHQVKKNEFLYEWLDSYTKLFLPIEALPLKDKSVVEALSIRSVAEYLDIYLCCGGTQTADCFEAYCHYIMETHRVEPKFFIGRLSTSYAAMLYMMKDCPVKPVALSDTNMMSFFQSMIFGGQA